MRTLILNDETEYEVDWCNGDRGILYANLITDAGFLKLASDFSDSEKTREIIVTTGEDHQTVYKGYTDLVSIVVDSWRTGTTMVTLKQPPLQIEGA